MTEDRRSNQREGLDAQPFGHLLLLCDGKEIRIIEVMDISPFGIGLILDHDIASGSEVTLFYQHGETDLSIAGKVVWSMPVSDGMDGKSLCRAGIYFQADELELSVKMFNELTSSSG